MSNANDLPVLSDAQWEIMNLIWERGESTVADVWNVLHERRGVSRNTVQTLIARLEEKGWLARHETGGSLLYAPTVSREKSQQSSVQHFVDTVFNGSAEGLVLTLLNGKSLSPDEADRIRQLIAAAKRRKS